MQQHQIHQFLRVNAMFDIAEELKKLPQKPGVYIMKDSSEGTIYVGKAVNLRNRVRQYFQASSAAQNPKVRSMTPNIASFEYIVTDNELEALILECNLIKTHHPKYNVTLKDDKTYPFLKLTVNEPFPRLFITRRHDKDRAKYFGPFTGGVNEVLDVVNRIWPLRRCAQHLPRETEGERPCLNYFIRQCPAPCNGLISQEEYGKTVDEVISFLNGDSGEIVKRMEAEMTAYSENLEYEKAADVLKKISYIKRLDDDQKIFGHTEAQQDVIAFARDRDEALVQVFFVRGGKMTGREHFMMSGVDSLTREEVMTEFLKRFYGETTYIPKEIILETDIVDRDTITRYLSGIKGQNVTVTAPQRGDKLRLVRLAAKNASLSLAQFGEQMKRDERKTLGALSEIREALGLSTGLERIEAYDISNIQGFESVGSMVVFEQGRPKRSDYRKFRIKGVQGADDCASMEEVLTRRLSRYKAEKESNPAAPKFSVLPDMLFVDGGLGQISAAMNAMRKLSISIPVCGMVKDDRHRTRGLLWQGREVALPASGEGFKLVTRIQDEVHRFAVEYHRKLREKKQIHSLLDDIPGIGEVRRKALMKHFGDIHKIRAAGVEELSQAEGMNARAARAVYEFFRT